MSALVLGFILLTSGLWMQTTAEYMIGDCNLTYFISYGQKCQRQMITNLATNPSTNCSAEYQDEKECLRDHIAVCLGKEYHGHINLVANLLLYQLYHCGNVEYKHNPTYGIVLKLMQCQREAFMDTEICWSYFRERLNANRTDPMLCREYAIAKECMAEKAKANCQICDYLRRDTFNPFCPNDTDPWLQVNACRDLLMPLSCDRLRTYKMALDCEHEFVASFLGNTRPDCRSVELAFKRCLDSRFVTFCPDYARKQRLKDDIQKAVTSFLRGRRFFCSQDINFRTIDLDIKVRPLFPCNSQFLPEMEKCALPLRGAYRLAQNITAAQLCRHFKTAVNCSNNVQATNCKVEKEVTSMTDNTYNSFCEFETEHSVSGAQFVSTEAIIFVTAFGLTL